MNNEYYAHYNTTAQSFITQATTILEQMIDINEIDMILFEASGGNDPAINAAKKSNAELANNSTGFLAKAINAVKNMIHEIIENIKDFFAKMFMSKEERMNFDELVKAAKNNPKLKGKKIHVSDAREINKQLEAIKAEARAGIQDILKNPDTPMDNFISNLTNKLKGIGKGVTGELSIETALRIAASDRGTARMISRELENENSELSKLLKEYAGDKEGKRIKKDIKACTKIVSLRRIIVQACHGQYENVEQAVSSVMDDVTTLMKDDIKKNTKGYDKDYSVDKDGYKHKLSDEEIDQNMKKEYEAKKFNKEHEDEIKQQKKDKRNARRHIAAMGARAATADTELGSTIRDTAKSGVRVATTVGKEYVKQANPVAQHKYRKKMDEKQKTRAFWSPSKKDNGNEDGGK